MTMPGFTAPASLDAARHHYHGKSYSVNAAGGVVLLQFTFGSGQITFGGGINHCGWVCNDAGECAGGCCTAAGCKPIGRVPF
jgi:hypothetical protein